MWPVTSFTLCYDRKSENFLMRLFIDSLESREWEIFQLFLIGVPRVHERKWLESWKDVSCLTRLSNLTTYGGICAEQLSLFLVFKMIMYKIFYKFGIVSRTLKILFTHSTFKRPDSTPINLQNQDVPFQMSNFTQNYFEKFLELSVLALNKLQQRAFTIKEIMSD